MYGFNILKVMIYKKVTDRESLDNELREEYNKSIDKRDLEIINVNEVLLKKKSFVKYIGDFNNITKEYINKNCIKINNNINITDYQDTIKSVFNNIKISESQVYIILGRLFFLYRKIF
ncbi:MAG: hypothetical protein KatS3mg003_1927 [Candidatus Nitrosocaldaceae archaeon]|nr:MAG: hypothetical protein KatS3mg003_1927 [Candidatus Nitrosocaldaceae archaeon]